MFNIFRKNNITMASPIVRFDLYKKESNLLILTVFKIKRAMYCNSPTNMKDFNIKEIKSLASTALNKKTTNIQVTNVLSKEVVTKVIEKIGTVKSIEDPNIVWILVAGVLQRGGSNQKAGNSIVFSFGDYTLTSHDLQNALHTTQKGSTNRQLARTIADEIQQIAAELNLPGDLHSQMRYEYPNLSDSDAVWCSNFQTTNPKCPDLVRDWLVKNYKSRFNK